MTRTKWNVLRAALALCAAGWACSPPSDARSSHDARAVEEGGRRAPKTDEERALLDAAAKLPAGQTASAGSAQISAGERYAAASGATCREVSVTGSAGLDEVSLACVDEEGWFFVPALAGSMSSPGLGGAAP